MARKAIVIGATSGIGRELALFYPKTITKSVLPLPIFALDLLIRQRAILGSFTRESSQSNIFSYQKKKDWVYISKRRRLIAIIVKILPNWLYKRM
ncbi:hypothetical protein [Allomuricauda sp. R78024]|uniref:hypothetical protein n=1 Tax=Allomuricauda sp. R78024 TaxID=3093867 RepID=UPI0037CA9DBA